VSHQDWCQLALEVEQPLCESSSGHLDATLVRRVDLEVVAVCAVEAQKARAFPWKAKKRVFRFLGFGFS
jgi:hypothetical protein